MEKTHVAVIIVLGMFLIGFVALFSWNSSWVQEIPMQVVVADYAGFNVDTGTLVFGTVPPGGQARRTVSISNVWGGDLDVLLSARGELAHWTRFSKERFTLFADANEAVNVTVAVPRDAIPGNYTGTVIISFTRT